MRYLANLAAEGNIATDLHRWDCFLSCNVFDDDVCQICTSSQANLYESSRRLPPALRGDMEEAGVSSGWNGFLRVGK